LFTFFIKVSTAEPLSPGRKAQQLKIVENKKSPHNGFPSYRLP
jgi:hypothetical protein